MRSVILALSFAACSAGFLRSRAEVNEVHPIVKVITLLEQLGATAKEQGQTEEIAYTKFEYWCKTSKSTLTADISERKAIIETLGDTIEAKSAEEKSLQSQIAELDDEILAQEGIKSKSISNRAAANGLFVKTDSDLEDTIKACADCITALEGAYNKTEGGGASLLNFQRAQRKVRELLGFLEVKATAVQLNTIQDFLRKSTNATNPIEASGDYKAHIDVYKFKSNSVIELLKELKEKFEEEKLAGVKAETNSLNAHDLQVAELDHAIAAAKASKDEKNIILGETQGDLNTAKTEKGLEEEALEAGEDTLKSTTQACTLKASEWQERSEIRKSEIAAIESAVGILTKVAGVRTEAPPNPTLSAASFLQLGASPKDAKAKAVQLLRAAAQTTHSHTLERLAMAIASKSVGIHYNKPGAFDEIINMIQKMIYKLQADQTSEDKHKDWCDKELEKTSNAISDKSDKVSFLGAKISDLKATEAQLTQQITEDTRLIGELTAKMKELTEIREVGKKENALAIKDAEDAIEALAQATAVLTEFYKSSGAVAKEPWEFLQADPKVELPANPATWESPYTAVADPTKQPEGIIAVLETTSQKFSQMVADTKAQEASDQDTFDAEKKASTIEMARLRQESEELSEQKKRANSNIQSESASEKHVQKELDAWNQYNADLKPACVDGDSSYDDRKAARDEEIEALREAETILKTAFDGLNSTGFLQIHRHSF